MTRRDLPAWLPLTLLGLALLALFHRLLSGQVLFWGLPSLQFYPWRHYAFSQLRAGRLPTWNPYVGAGAPLLANYQSAIFYPPNWLFLALPDPQAMGAIALLHVIWAGIGMWLFSGALGLSRFGRGMSTLSYALSGYLMGRIGSFPTADAVAWIPWLFWLVHLVITRQRWRDVGWLGLAFGMQLLAGHAQTTWYSTLALGAYALWLAARRMRRVPHPRRVYALLLAGTGITLGLMLAALQLVPTLEYFRESQRSGGLDFETAANLSYSPYRLITLFSPNFYGTPADGSYYTKGIYFEDAAYIGFIPAISALAALVGWLRRRRFLMHYPALASVPFWTALSLVSLLLATGRYGSVFPLLYQHVPTFNSFREPVRWLILAEFSLSVLAGIGTQHWGRGRRVIFWSRLAAAGGGVTILLMLAAPRLVQTDSKSLDGLILGLLVLGCWITAAALLTLAQPDSASLASPVLWRTTVLACVAVDLAWAASGLNPTVTGDFYRDFGVSRPQGRIYWFADYEEEIKFDHLFVLSDYRVARDQWPKVRTSLLPNLNMLDRVLLLNNFDPLLPRYHRRYVELIEELGARAGALLRAAGVSQVYGRTPLGWQDETPALAPQDETPLAWLVPWARWYASEDALEAALRAPDWDPSTVVLLRGERPTGRLYLPFLAQDKVTVVENRANKVRYQVRTLAPAYLVISTTWYPGWTAMVDGRKVPLYRANLAFQAIPIPAGGGEVTLQYEVTDWGTGAWISGAALLIAFSLIGWGSVVGRVPFRRVPPPPPD